MNLYVFKPHAGWQYCGGAILIVAEDDETAFELLVKDEPDAKPIYLQDESGVKDAIDTWVLKYVLRLARFQAPARQVLLNDWNYA